MLPQLLPTHLPAFLNTRQAKLYINFCNLSDFLRRLFDGTICPRSSDPSYIVTFYTKWGTTSWTDGIALLNFISKRNKRKLQGFKVNWDLIFGLKFEGASFQRLSTKLVTIRRLSTISKMTSVNLRA